MREFDIEKEIEKTLGSLDNHQRVEASPFFYTKLQQRLENKETAQVATFSFWNIWQPTLVAILIFINVFTVLELTGGTDYNDAVNTMASDYGINTFEKPVEDYIIK